MGLTRRYWRFPFLLFVVSLTLSATLPVPDFPKQGPDYAPDQIYKLNFQGFALGMDFPTVCAKALALAYVRRPADTMGRTCDMAILQARVKADTDAAASDRLVLVDEFFGQGWQDLPAHVKTQFGSVKFLTLSFRKTSSKSTSYILSDISVMTDEPKIARSLATDATKSWGLPTRDHVWASDYREMIYGPSQQQADSEMRYVYNSCILYNGCSGPRGEGKSGAYCASFLPRHAIVYARQVIYPWGRNITISDQRIELRDFRKSGALNHLRTMDDASSFACPIPRIH